ncbi:ankyrin repeat-containing domain protein [Xylaria sp. FL0064]|nr:ankyrin repeat-containing domain protein [Xylaria sp. FL0064]
MNSSQLPKLPAAHNGLVNYIFEHSHVPMAELMKPYREFKAKLREMYAQDRRNPILQDPYLNILPLFNQNTSAIQTRARDLNNETQEQKDKYIMPLPDDKRRPNGSPAVVESLKEFRHNFGVFSESSLSDMDWENVVAAGSSVVNCLLPVPPEYKASKRALRQYYHEKFCPASDVDLFLYGLSEEQAIQKIKDIETRIRDAILSEVTVVRTKNAITICSQYPARHVQIHEDEVADWVDEDEVSNYHTFTVPYGVKFHAKKIEKLCYTKDLLLNAEWNQPKEREVYLHRHPAFFGRVEDVIGDCCGTCPKLQTPEEIETAAKESEIYVSGNATFRTDDPGRQASLFYPLTSTPTLQQEKGDCADPNTRDYTGRTPLHLAVISSTPAIVKCLVDHGARLVARIADGRTALHLAAARGNIEMVKILLEKSNANEEEEEEKQDQRRKARRAKRDSASSDDESAAEDDGSDGELIDDSSSDDRVQSIATGSFVKVDNMDDTKTAETIPLDDDQNDPDFYQIDAIAWDSKCSALHLAILGGHCEVVKLLCQEYGADVLLPVKIGDGSYSNPNTAILTLILALALPIDKAIRMCETLLNLGATSSHADITGITAFHRFIKNNNMEVIDFLWENDKLGLKTAINHVAVSGNYWRSSATSPLMTAIDEGNPILVLKLLDAGAKPEIDFASWLQGAKYSSDVNLGGLKVF